MRLSGLLNFIFQKIVALAALRGLKRLIIRIADLKMMEDIMAELKECIAKHAPTLEFLHLDFMTTTTISSRLCKFVPLEFLKLKRLYLEAYLTYVGVGDHDLDIFGLNEIVEVSTCIKFRQVADPLISNVQNYAYF